MAIKYNPLEQGDYNRQLADPTVFRGPELLGHITILGTQENGDYDALVPTAAISSEDVAVNVNHVNDLQQSMRSRLSNGRETGQLSPVLLAHIPNTETFPIIDGFHRVEAMRGMGESAVRAAVQAESTWEDVLDLRIIAATSHKSVKFSRVMDWVDGAWARTPWSEKITVDQAFSLGFNKRMSGAGIGLDPEEVAEIRRWTAEKGQQWGLASGTLYNHLAIARDADPKLVKEAREGAGRRGLDYITPEHLRSISRTLPGKDNYDKQHIVAQAAKDNRLTAPETKLLANQIAEVEAPDIDAAIIERAVHAVTKFTGGTVKFSAVKGLDKHAGEMAKSQFESEQILAYELELAALSIANAILAANYTPSTKKAILDTIRKNARPEAIVSIDRLPGNKPLYPSTTVTTELDASPERIEKIKAFLPKFGRTARRAVVLADFYNLPTKAIGQLIGKDEEATQDILEGAHKNIV